MLAPSHAALDLIRQHEGLSLKAYPDPATHADPWTVGYGHTGRDVTRGMVWSVDQCEAALGADCAHFARILNALIGTAPTPTTQGQFDAMISLMFNIGQGNFAKSSVLANHLARRYPQAAASFKLWNKAAGRVMAGLVTRRADEAALYARAK